MSQKKKTKKKTKEGDRRLDKRVYEEELDRPRDAMLAATDLPESPWNVVRSNDKRRARLNCISHLLSTVPYERIAPKMPRRSSKGAYDDVAALAGRDFVPELF
jgi:polyphosphate kinase 2 (PPK2 family)